MTERGASSLPVQLVAWYSIERLGWSDKLATTIRMGRNVVSLAVNANEKLALLRTGDVVLVEVETPAAEGLPQRCLACTCIVTDFMEEVIGVGGRIDLKAECMYFREVTRREQPADACVGPPDASAEAETFGYSSRE
jgi:hypothetical protein